MFDSRTNSKPAVPLRAKTLQLRPVGAELRAGRRWKWWGKRGWWLHCSLLHEQSGTWQIRRFAATLSEACALLNVYEDDWTWQPESVEEVSDKESQQKEYVPFLML
jgi:hypothetical protein